MSTEFDLTEFDLVVIGAGPGGYVAAIRAAQLGMTVAVVERERQLGGTCLRVGCIPSKALLETSELFERAEHEFSGRGIIASKVSVDIAAMMKHKNGVVSQLDSGIQGLLKKHKIRRVSGHGRLAGAGCVEVTGEEAVRLTGRHILIATGSVPAMLHGVEPDGDRIGTSTEALEWPDVPEHLVVIGAGAIGLELGTVWRRLGSAVTVLEFLPRILPGMDEQVARDALRLFEKQGLQFRLETRVARIKVLKKSCRVEIDGGDPIACDRVLVAVGRKPCTTDLGLDSVGVTTDDRGFIPVNAEYQTSAAGVYAVGDVIGGAMLAHKAEDEGIACVEKICTGFGHVNYDVIPSVVYTAPEIASVGASEETLKAADIPYRVGRFAFAANGRARASGHTEGYVKLLAHNETDRVLGVHIIGAHAGELIAEAAAAMEFGASSEDIARCCHAHPTLAEALREAAFAADRRAIHS